MPSAEQCRVFAAECKKLAANPKLSARRSTVLKNIAHSWMALTHQFEDLAIIEKSEAV